MNLLANWSINGQPSSLITINASGYSFHSGGAGLAGLDRASAKTFATPGMCLAFIVNFQAVNEFVKLKSQLLEGLDFDMPWRFTCFEDWVSLETLAFCWLRFNCELPLASNFFFLSTDLLILESDSDSLETWSQGIWTPGMVVGLTSDISDIPTSLS